MAPWQEAAAGQGLASTRLTVTKSGPPSHSEAIATSAIIADAATHYEPRATPRIPAHF